MALHLQVNQSIRALRHLLARRSADGLRADAGPKLARLFFSSRFSLYLSYFCRFSLCLALSLAPIMESLPFCRPALAAPGIAENLLSGPDAAANNKQLTKSIDWLTSLPDAREKAAREGKLILWLHMLGNIDGFT
ncbi:MAG: hypothetical protein HY986_22860 [Candidatus Melainabacteria bacterium]|nr:hypothetical protein [Candidatus Melainabacteria bacterium]